MEVQTRTFDGELRYFATIKEAFKYAEENNDVWKISFSVETGERVRLVSFCGDWTYENVMEEIKKLLAAKGIGIDVESP